MNEVLLIDFSYYLIEELTLYYAKKCFFQETPYYQHIGKDFGSQLTMKSQCFTKALKVHTYLFFYKGVNVLLTSVRVSREVLRKGKVQYS